MEMNTEAVRRKKMHRKQHIDRLLGVLVVLLLCIAAGFGAMAVYRYFHPNVAQETIPLFTVSDAEKMVEEQTVYEHSYYEIIPEDMELLRQYQAMNEDTVGVITIRDSILCHPLMQSPARGESYYLSHDLEHNHNFHGVPFLTLASDLARESGNNIIYGHNMKTGAMFGSLHKYEQTAYCNKHRFIQFDTLYEEGQYAIFAVATIRLTPGTAGYVSLTDLRSDRRETRRKALNALTSVSVYNNILDVNEEDQLLLLITCVGDDDQRLIVAARRLRENESPDNLILKNGGNLS